jgi:uncharacterized protein YxeA
MKSVNVFKILFLIVLPLLILSVFLWYIQDKKAFNIYILDKTVPDKARTEHKSFNWILTYYNFTDKNHKLYSFKKDYYGFFPLSTSDKNREYKIRSLRLYEVLSISDDLDAVYYTDTYGVSYQDWFKRPPDKLHSPLIYGGLNQNDYLLLSEMRRKNKLIITEFNMLGSPTSDLIRQKTETLFDFYWTGWTGCYCRSLNASNPNLPSWLVTLYEQKYKKKWEFNGPGIILVQEKGDIIILEDKRHLTLSYPQIITGAYGQKTYKLPPVQNYLFWFDIINTGHINKVVANYQLSLTGDGEMLLKKYGLRKEFPAIIEHLDNYRFYYFAGDFADRNISIISAYFKGMPFLAKAFYWNHSGSKQAFFWRYYFPLIYNILENNLISTIKKDSNKIL